MIPKKPGRPQYVPTDKERAQCKTLAAMGVPVTDIAIVLQVSAPTLRRHFRHELDTGIIEANAKVAQSLFKQATDSAKPSVVAAIFWLKVRAGWAEAGARDPNAPPREETPGKREQANRAARVAQNGTEWESLLSTKASLQ